MSRRGRLILDQTSPPNRDGWSKWILPALAVSLLLHLLFWNWSRHVTIDRMSDAFYDQIVPRTFNIERADIDPRLLEPEPEEKKPDPVDFKLPEEKISLERQTPKSPDLTNTPPLDQAIMNEKPQLPDMPKSNASTPSSNLVPVDDALVNELTRDMPEVSETTTSEPILALRASEAMPAQPVGGAGFSNLDELLAETGPLTPEKAPIMLPSDLLFEYDDHRLQPGALASLEKLGQLLKRNPKSRFLIEGHSDAFGTDEYNMTLSRLRADSVRIWLIDMVGIPPESIITVGRGKSRLIAPETGTIEEQKINRRVEIVIQGDAP
jgi:outer membrane protein OmpA-like peptidoglycan-associated protein